MVISRAQKKALSSFSKRGRGIVKCLTKAYDGPHQTTIILSTPFIERKHPTACPTDVSVMW